MSRFLSCPQRKLFNLSRESRFSGRVTRCHIFFVSARFYASIFDFLFDCKVLVSHSTATFVKVYSIR